MKPLNHCLNFHLKQRKMNGGRNSDSPRWVLFHDSDEYLYPVDTSMTILQALEQHEEVCCLVVSFFSGVPAVSACKQDGLPRCCGALQRTRTGLLVRI